ncbi:cysteine hydrolase [Salinisphaera sp.]|uniref:cysteine hydrolase family protein n=1 Tax=Salinisphaera sp. TaxID=1914330 RepID=UPI000C3C8132|nr:cysteine hydrolase [Salinisphaera sp.]MBS62658.1 isochorismatase [Salinisphaera sp.]
MADIPRQPVHAQATAAWPRDELGISLVRPSRPARPLALAEAAPEPITIDAARTALVVVDMQNDFCHDEGWFAARGVDIGAIQAVVPHVRLTIDAAHDHGMPVIFLNWGIRADALEMSVGQLAFGRLFGRATGYAEAYRAAGEPALVTGTWGAATIDALAPQPRDIVVHKNRFSGFWHNELDAVLRRLDVTTLCFAGVNTDRCVLASLQDATFAGYDAVLIDDATATPSSAIVREAACTIVRQLYGFTTTVDAFVDAH